MGNTSKEMETLAKYQKKMLKIKNTTETKNIFGDLTSRLVTAKKNQWAWRQVNKNFPNWHTKRKKNKNNKWTIQELWGNFKRYYICVKRISEGEEKQNKAEEIFEVIMAANFFEIKDKHPTT